MWIVRLALRRTYTFVVMAVLILAVSLVAIDRMSTDIFPEINIPVVSVVWQYTGMPADEVEERIVLINERVLTTSVNDIEHSRSRRSTAFRSTSRTWRTSTWATRCRPTWSVATAAAPC